MNHRAQIRPRHDRRRQAGLTLIELIVAFGILAVVTAMGVPSYRQFQADQNLRTVSRELAGAFNTARSLALVSGNNHLVFVGIGGNDACGNPLVDVLGNPVPILVADDGAPGAGNCCFDDALGERVASVAAEPGINWGTTFAPAAPAANFDTGGGVLTTGSSFNRRDGVTQANWVLFGPDGLPVAFDPVCNIGTTGSGGGGVYLTNGNRDYSVIITALGSVKVQRFERGAAAWIN